MESTKSKNRFGVIASVIGGIAITIGFFLPWYDNGVISGNGAGLAQKFGITLFLLILVMAVIAFVSSFLMIGAEFKKATVLCGIRVIAVVIGLYLLMGVRKLMTRGATPDVTLIVNESVGFWLIIIGFAAMAIGTIKDFFATRRNSHKWSTMDLVLLVMTAAIYAAALLTLSFIKLAPGTWLRPGNALQAPFGILFGIPGCIGIALGNLISDITQGTAPHVMVMGLLTNFLTAFLPYLFVSNAKLTTRRSVVEFVCIGSVLGALIVASSIFINVILGLTPKAIALAFFPTTFLNQLLPSLLLGIPLIKLLYPFVIRAGLYRGREAARDNIQITEVDK